MEMIIILISFIIRIINFLFIKIFFIWSRLIELPSKIVFHKNFAIVIVIILILNLGHNFPTTLEVFLFCELDFLSSLVVLLFQLLFGLLLFHKLLYIDFVGQLLNFSDDFLSQVRKEFLQRWNGLETKLVTEITHEIYDFSQFVMFFFQVLQNLSLFVYFRWPFFQSFFKILHLSCQFVSLCHFYAYVWAQSALYLGPRCL